MYIPYMTDQEFKHLAEKVDKILPALQTVIDYLEAERFGTEIHDAREAIETFVDYTETHYNGS